MEHDFFGWALGEGRTVVVTLVAGACGGLIRSILNKQKSAVDYLINIASGSICGIYLGPSIASVVAPFLGEIGVNYENVTSLGGFIAGVLGITLVGWAIDFGRKKMESITDENEK